MGSDRETIPDEQLLLRRPLVIRSFRQWVVLQVHRTSHNRHSTFDSFGCRQFLHSFIAPFKINGPPTIDRNMPVDGALSLSAIPTARVDCKGETRALLWRGL